MAKLLIVFHAYRQKFAGFLREGPGESQFSPVLIFGPVFAWLVILLGILFGCCLFYSAKRHLKDSLTIRFPPTL